jgi:hypothetical protein
MSEALYLCQEENMSETETRGETHGCIVCGKLYQLYVVYDPAGKFVDFKVMSADARPVRLANRPLVACEKHSQEQIEAAVAKVYGSKNADD